MSKPDPPRHPATAAPSAAAAAAAAAAAEHTATTPTRPKPDAAAPAAAAEPTAAQRDAMDWIARSDYGRWHEWAAQHVLLPAAQRHPQFSAAAAFAAALLHAKVFPLAVPSAEAVRCALDAFVRHGLQLNAPLNTQCEVTAKKDTPFTGRVGGAAAGDHTPLTLSLFWCPAMAHALLSLPPARDDGDGDGAVSVDVNAVVCGAAAVAWAVRKSAYRCDARGNALVLALAARSSRATLAGARLFERAVGACDVLDPDAHRYADSGDDDDDDGDRDERYYPVLGLEDVRVLCALVQQLLTDAFVTDDGDTRGLVLTTAQRYPTPPLERLTQWCDDATGDARCHVQLLGLYEATRDALRGVLERQRVFRDALPAVLSEALRPAPREVCALVSAYVLWPVPNLDAHSDAQRAPCPPPPLPPPAPPL